MPARSASAIAAVVAALVLGGCAATPSSTVESPTVEADAGVEAQLAYLMTHFDERNTAEFGSLDGTDCVNFTSQGLRARGWKMTDDWWHLAVVGQHQYSKAWVSSTTFAAYLDDHPSLAEEATAADVAIGDLVQFDYDNSGNRDHTATVSCIDNGEIFVVQHSPDADFKPVQEVLDEHGGGGTAYIWKVLD